MSEQPPLPYRIAWFAPWTWKRRWKITVSLVIIAVAYPLGIGPMFGLWCRGWISTPTLFLVYGPIYRLAVPDGIFEKWLMWYCGLFCQ